MRISIFLLVLYFIFLFNPVSSFCWVADLFNYPFMPEELLVIDKQKQKLFVVVSKSPITEKYQFLCKTGRKEGDKWEEGDLRTPEGIYFIESEITKGIDPDKYGSLAFTLNYPNPVDRIKGKKGHGIWIHGRGSSVNNYRTQGCVALTYQDIRKLKGAIKLGKTPVIIAKSIKWEVNKFENEESNVKQIVSSIYRWAKAWSFREKDFFSFYDPKVFNKNKGGYKSFFYKKSRLFKTYKWIDVAVYMPKVVFGPEYAVSFFYQAYVAYDFSSFGIKRLYWQKRDGTWKIVGDEWRSLDPLYVKRLYLRDKTSSIITWLKEWKNAWINKDINKYISFYAQDATLGVLKGKDAILKYKKKLWRKDPPKKVNLSDLKVKLSSRGFVVSFIQRYESKRGYKDVGRKILLVVPKKNGWLIRSETWKRKLRY